MQVWGLVRQGDATPQMEVALRAATEGRGWAYLGTLERYGLGPDSLRDLIERAGGQGLLLENLTVLATNHREVALCLLVLETAGIPVWLAEERDADPLERALAAASEATPQGRSLRAGMQARALRGLGLGKLPYGYRMGEGGQPQVEPEEAAIARLIFHLSFQGKGIRVIVAELNRRGLQTRRGGAWSMITVRDMLRNRFYTGTYIRFGMRVAGNHPSLIPNTLFQQVQQRLDLAAQRAGHARGEPFLLSGLVYCGACGSRMIGVTRQQSWRRKDGTARTRRYRYYQCGGRANRGLCAYHTRRAPELEEEVLKTVAKRSLTTGEPRFPEGERDLLQKSSGLLQRDLAKTQRPGPANEPPDALRRLVRRAVAAGMPATQLRQQARALLQGEEHDAAGAFQALLRRIQWAIVHDGRIEVRLWRGSPPARGGLSNHER